MKNLNIYCLSLKYYQVIDRLPSYIKPLGLGNEEYPEKYKKVAEYFFHRGQQCDGLEKKLFEKLKWV